MNDDRELRTDDSDDDTIRLLRLAGTHAPVSTTRAARVRTAVHAEWRANVRRRTVRRRFLLPSFVVATAGAVILLGSTWSLVDRRTAPPPGEQVGIVERLDGSPRRLSNSSQSPAATNLSLRDPVRIGDWIETDQQSRVALRLSDGASVRLDAGSRARPLSSNVIELSAGAVYVDTGRESGHVEVRTEMATARDIGTQFEIRLLDRSVRLRVRTGVVELADNERSITGRAGTEITLSAGDIVRRPLPPHGPEWDWTSRISPPMEIEGVVLADFLARVGREIGWVVQYADPALAQQAAGISLHGSVNGLSPREAIEVVITTSGLRHRVEDGSLVVLREAAAR